MSCKRFLVILHQSKYGCSTSSLSRLLSPPVTPHLLLPTSPLSRLASSGSLPASSGSANTVLLYKNLQTKTKFFRLIFIMSGVQLIFWSYLSYFAFAELRQETLCQQADQTAPGSSLTEGERAGDEGAEPASPPWYTSLRWRLTISLMALGMGVFFATTACMYPLRVVQTMHFVRGKTGGVRITTYSPFRGTREVQAALSDIRLAGSRSEAGKKKGRQVGMKVKGHRLFYLLDRDGEFPSPTLFDTLIGARRM